MTATLLAAAALSRMALAESKYSDLYPGPNGVSIFENASGPVLIFPLKWAKAIEAARSEFVKSVPPKTKLDCFNVRLRDNSKNLPNSVRVGFHQHRNPNERVRGGGGPCGNDYSYVVSLDGKIIEGGWER